MMTKITFAFVLGTIAAVAGCAKQLSKEEAKNLLTSTAESHAPQCSMKERSIEYDPLRRSITYSDRRWGDLAKTVGVVKDVTCTRSPSGADDCSSQVAVAPDCKEESRQAFGQSRQRDCTLSIACGSASVEVESIVTEGARATVKYNIQPVVDKSIASAVAPKPEGGFVGDMVKITGDKPSTASAVAVRADDGKWMLGR